jgi:uridine kinase
MADLVERIMALPDDVPRLVGIDGVDGVGKTVFADDLALELRRESVNVVRIGIDGFHRPRADRHRRGPTSPEGYFWDSFDIPSFILMVVSPAKPGGTGIVTRAVFDHRVECPVAGEDEQVGPGDVVLVDGVFLHRDEFEGVWDLSVFLRAPIAVASARMAERDGVPMDDRRLTRYREGQKLYLTLCTPEQRATVVVDHTDAAAPWLVGGTGLADLLG